MFYVSQLGYKCCNNQGFKVFVMFDYVIVLSYFCRRKWIKIFGSVFCFVAFADQFIILFHCDLYMIYFCGFGVYDIETNFHDLIYLQFCYWTDRT